MSSFMCPFCNSCMSVDHGHTHSVQYPSFDRPTGYVFAPNGSIVDESTIAITFYKCPQCASYSIEAKGIGVKVKAVNSYLLPQSQAKQYPSYIPAPIRTDYEEACAIVNLSPKAAATLARRCLQGIIRDYWGIKKNRLIDEISELEPKVPQDLWQALDSLRSLGNIGAHMEKDTNLIVDIDPDEAIKLIKLIELLIQEWYIARESRNRLLADIVDINSEKQEQRKKTT